MTPDLEALKTLVSTIEGLLRFERQPDLEVGSGLTVMRSERISPAILILDKAA